MVVCFAKYGFSQLKWVVDWARLITALASTSKVFEWYRE